MGPDLGIEGIGFGQLAGRPRNIKDLSWIHHDDREAVGGEGAREGHFEPTGGLEHNKHRGQPTQLRRHGHPTRLIIRDREACVGRHRYIELGLGDIDTDTHVLAHRDLLDGPAF